jgi:hypothetical protein
MDLHFFARITTTLKEKQNSVILSEASADQRAASWRAESIQTQAEGPAFLSSPETEPGCPILLRGAFSRDRVGYRSSQPVALFSTNHNCHPERSAAKDPSSGARCIPARSRRTPRSNGTLNRAASEREGNRAQSDRPEFNR